MEVALMFALGLTIGFGLGIIGAGMAVGGRGETIASLEEERDSNTRLIRDLLNKNHRHGEKFINIKSLCEEAFKDARRGSNGQ